MDETAPFTLILDEKIIVTDTPCAGAVLIVNFPDGYFACTVTARGACVFGLEGGQPHTIHVRELLELLESGRDLLAQRQEEAVAHRNAFPKT
jgi:hypothetical protein